MYNWSTFHITFDYSNSCVISISEKDDKDVPQATAIYVAKIVLCALGFVLNLMSMIIFLRTKPRCIFSTLLLLLSVVEVGLCISGVMCDLFYFLFIVRSMQLENPWVFMVLTYILNYGGWFLYKASILARNWTIAYIAWRRYRAVSDPIKNMSSINKSDIYRVLGVIYCISFALTLPRMFEMNYIICIQLSQVQDIPTFLIFNPYYSFYGPLYFSCVSPLPICVVIFSSLALLRLLRVRDAETNTLTIQNTRNNSPTKTVFILCAIFTICETPSLLAGALQHVNTGDYIDFLILGGLAKVLVNVDSVLNFCIYYYSMRSFKHVFGIKYLSRCCRPKQRNDFNDGIELRRESYFPSTQYARCRQNSHML